MINNIINSTSDNAGSRWREMLLSLKQKPEEVPDAPGVSAASFQAASADLMSRIFASAGREESKHLRASLNITV